MAKNYYKPMGTRYALGDTGVCQFCLLNRHVDCTGFTPKDEPCGCGVCQW